MLKKIFVLTALIVVVFSLSGCTKIKRFAEDFIEKIRKGKLVTQELALETDSGQFKLKAEIADESDERKKGYMFRKEIEDNEGMWFEFEDEAVRKFWMRNMEFPVDIIFANKNLEIRGFLENMPVCEKDPCVIYDSPKDTQYAFETKAGFVKEKGAETGDRFIFSK